MHITDGLTVFTRITLLPYNLRNKIMASKQLITQNANICLLSVINTYPDASFCFVQQIPQDGKTRAN